MTYTHLIVLSVFVAMILSNSSNPEGLIYMSYICIYYISYTHLFVLSVFVAMILSNSFHPEGLIYMSYSIYSCN